MNDTGHLISHHVQKFNWKWIKGLDANAKIIKLLEEHMGIYIHALRLNNDVLDIISKAQVTKENIY